MHSITDNYHRTEMPEKRTYNVDDIAKILNVSKASVYRLIRSGLFRTVRIGKSIRISKQSFDEWLDKNINDYS